MPLAEMRFSALAPGANEPVVQSCTQRRTGQWNHSPRPLLHYLSAGFGGDPLNHSWHKSVYNFLFQQLTADVHARRAGRGNPQFGNLAIGIEFKSVDQT